MANTIKHKRGSGSNPSASDLAVGELAIRTDTGVVFTKKDDGSVAEIAGGGGTVADDVIYENSQTISNNYTISTNKNAMSAMATGDFRLRASFSKMKNIRAGSILFRNQPLKLSILS